MGRTRSMQQYGVKMFEKAAKCERCVEVVEKAGVVADK